MSKKKIKQRKAFYVCNKCHSVLELKQTKFHVKPVCVCNRCGWWTSNAVYDLTEGK